jgi:CcmD family protein
MMTRPLLTLGAVAIFLLLPSGVVAQEGVFAPEVQMRHFWHVFIAYSIAWIFLFSWVVSILRRMKGVEERLRGRN